jgi:hypothetical protein
MVLRVAPEAAELDLDSVEWDEVPVLSGAGKAPILISVSRDDGTPECLFREEVREFAELLEDVEDSPAKERVVRHLRASGYVVANQLPTSDLDDDGFRASALLLEYFVTPAGGLVQADAERYYEGDEVILELP